MNEERQILLLGSSLLIGLLIGLERGWHDMRNEKPHVAGVRTFGLIGLLGGVAGLTARELDQPVYGFVFLALAAAMITAYVLGQRNSQDHGITSLVAGLLTFALGTLATLGNMVAATAIAVIASLLLGIKPLLHGWLERMDRSELHATLKLLVITMVLLPVLPDRGYGPGEALNPYEIWWMVVLIAAISFSGYFAIKAVGSDKGILITSLLAGLASSTALTLHFSRLARKQSADTDLLASGILLANATLFPRILVIALVINIDMARALWLPMLIMTLVILLPGMLAWRQRNDGADGELVQLTNPLELSAALRFGALLAVVMLLARLLEEELGGAGILALGAVSGIADLNAITLSLGRMSQESLSMPLAASAVVLASISNGVVKSLMAWLIGGRKLGLRITLPALAASLCGAAALWLTGYGPSF